MNKTEITRRILHCFRAPAGGLFRHVSDLVQLQYENGHDIGIACDFKYTNKKTNEKLESLQRICSLGVHDIAMSRWPSIRDIKAKNKLTKLVSHNRIGILHGHGAKGGAYARLVSQQIKKTNARILAVYTPHGGSLHFNTSTIIGKILIALEKRLVPLTDCLIFESEFAEKTYLEKIGKTDCPRFTVHNGIWPNEFEKLSPNPDCTDFVFIGELRHLKGVDILIDAVAKIAQRKPVTATIVGSGRDSSRLKNRVMSLGLEQIIVFNGSLPASEALKLGRCLIVPSRAESLPYVVLEAAGAGVPLIATKVGGIPEITDGIDFPFVAPGDTDALAYIMSQFIENSAPFLRRAERLRSLVQRKFRTEEMEYKISVAYESSINVSDAGSIN